MITKLLIIALCIVACSMIGLALNKISIEKVKYFEGLLGFINTLSSEIKFRQASLKFVLQEFLENNSSGFNTNLQEFLLYLEGKNEQLKLSKNKLTASELELVKSFFSSLGTSDDTTQLFELENYKRKFEVIFSEKESKHKKYGGLYLKLSFMCGVAIGILII